MDVRGFSTTLGLFPDEKGRPTGSGTRLLGPSPVFLSGEAVTPHRTNAAIHYSCQYSRPLMLSARHNTTPLPSLGRIFRQNY